MYMLDWLCVLMMCLYIIIYLYFRLVLSIKLVLWIFKEYLCKFIWILVRIKKVFFEWFRCCVLDIVIWVGICVLLEFVDGLNVFNVILLFIGWEYFMFRVNGVVIIGFMKVFSL